MLGFGTSVQTETQSSPRSTLATENHFLKKSPQSASYTTKHSHNKLFMKT